MNSAYFMSHAYELTRSWKCPTCKNAAKIPKNDNTPIRQATDTKVNETEKSPDNFILNDPIMPSEKPACEETSPGKLDSVNTAPRGKPGIHDNSFYATTETETPPSGAPTPQALIEMETLNSFQNFQVIFDQLTKNLQELSVSLTTCKEEVTEFRQQLTDMKTRILSLEQYEEEVKDLRKEVRDLRTELELRDQRDLSNDIEIKGIPEHRGENLQHVVKNLATKIGVQLEERDIDYITRVGKRNPETAAVSTYAGKAAGGSTQPRIIVVRLTRRAPRDKLLSEARIRRGITSDQLDVAGPPTQIYLNERLTKKNRHTYGLTRAVARELNYKYVWIKHGQIFLRKSDHGKVFQIQNEEDLSFATSINFQEQ